MTVREVNNRMIPQALRRLAVAGAVCSVACAGLWDPRTGRRVVAGTDFRMASGARTQNHRAYMYYGGNTTTRQDLTDPRLEVVDGTEPSLASLLVPPDADNTNQKRLVPDSEFALATDQTHWYLEGAEGPPVISLTGGNVAGLATFLCSESIKRAISRRNPAQQGVTGESWTVRMRWRRTGTVGETAGPGFFTARLVRHAVLPTTPAFGFSGTIICPGGISLNVGEINARTVNVWQEEEGVVLVVPEVSYIGGSLPYLSLFVELSATFTGEVNLQVDFVDATPGASGQPHKRTYTATATLTASDLMQFLTYDSTSAGTLSLPNPGEATLGARIYFEQANTGLLTIGAPASGSLLSPPNTTGNRALLGRYARAYAECRSATEWVLVGALG